MAHAVYSRVAGAVLVAGRDLRVLSFSITEIAVMVCAVVTLIAVCWPEDADADLLDW